MSGDVCNMTSLHMKGSAEFHNMSNSGDNVMANECYNYHTLNVEEGEEGELKKLLCMPVQGNLVGLG